MAQQQAPQQHPGGPSLYHAQMAVMNQCSAGSWVGAPFPWGNPWGMMHMPVPGMQTQMQQYQQQQHYQQQQQQQQQQLQQHYRQQQHPQRQQPKAAPAPAARTPFAAAGAPQTGAALAQSVARQGFGDIFDRIDAQQDGRRSPTPSGSSQQSADTRDAAAPPPAPAPLRADSGVEEVLASAAAALPAAAPDCFSPVDWQLRALIPDRALDCPAGAQAPEGVATSAGCNGGGAGGGARRAAPKIVVRLPKGLAPGPPPKAAGAGAGAARTAPAGGGVQKPRLTLRGVPAPARS
ncbi:hypothetical protein Rsub_07505 [Raphidocelis subcapitata]|uniref:Uncharacterized protein n=1 Tax=Raphidocelis subcapitata TaxID=307507 RepID=A0A2V0P554_9CHLO|nr:hypothetical protein Rsub_07505 [Raphidocelis subcapitata]|eukprot:GBF95004.1 hypothetical protein Rsub_07505 [Raphidocelis subcapitata]